MFIISLTYTKPATEADKYLEGHYQYIDKYIAEGKFLLVGRKVPRTGGVIICNVDTKEELEKIMREDPFVLMKLAYLKLLNLFRPEN